MYIHMLKYRCVYYTGIYSIDCIVRVVVGISFSRMESDHNLKADWTLCASSVEPVLTSLLYVTCNLR